jgi:AbrB family looped-hinge helix DNA binding protein
MNMLTITAKGQVTLRKEVLEHLGVKPGDKIEVEPLPNGRIEVKAARPKGDISKFFGSLAQKNGPHLTIEEMNKVISDAWAGKR